MYIDLMCHNTLMNIEIPSLDSTLLMTLAETFDAYFYTFRSNITAFSPDGVLNVDINLLQSLHMLTLKSSLQPLDTELEQSLFSSYLSLLPFSSWTRFATVKEDEEKIILYTGTFVAWIFTEPQDAQSTIAAIGRYKQKEDSSIEITPEIAYTFRGIYNQPKFILSLVDKAFLEIEETDESLTSFDYNNEPSDDDK